MVRKLSLITVVVCTCLVSSSPAMVIDFESLYPGVPYTQIDIPDGYGDMNWSEAFLAMTADAIPGSGYENGATGLMTAYTSYHAEVSMTRNGGGIFDFISADITAAHVDNLGVTIEGWRDGELIYTAPIFTSTDGPYSFTFNFMDVDTVWFKPPQGDGEYHIGIDNIEIVHAPEPATLSLLAVGGLALLRKRK